MPVMRPDKLRERQANERRDAALQGEDHPAAQRAKAVDQALENAEAVRLMVQSKGWKVLQEWLVGENTAIWNAFTDPVVVGEKAEIMRLQAIKYSGVEDVIEKILRTGEQIQRSKR